MKGDALIKSEKNHFQTPTGYTSDIAVFTIVSEDSKPFTPPKMTLKILLIKRAELDYKGNPNMEAGKWALPGGFVKPNETAHQAAKRKLEEETGIKQIHLKHFDVFDHPCRDPRGWIISNAHYAILPEHLMVSRGAKSDASEVKLFPISEIKNLILAFDHEIIIEEAVKRIRIDMLQTTVAQNFLPKEFTYSELQAVLATVSVDPAIINEQSFARKIKTLPFIEQVKGKTTQRTSKKGTQLYRFIDMDIIKPIYTARY